MLYGFKPQFPPLEVESGKHGGGGLKAKRGVEWKRTEREGRLGNMMDVRTASLMASVAAFQFWDASSWTPTQVRYGREWSGRCLGKFCQSPAR